MHITERRVMCSLRDFYVLFLAVWISATSLCQELPQVPGPQPHDAPAQWKNLVGMYTSPQDTILIAETDGQLVAVTRKLQFVPLIESERGRYELSDANLFRDTVLMFRWDGNERPLEFSAGTKSFRRLILGSENNASFHINPLKPAEELRAIALAAVPPREQGEFRSPDFVDLSTLDKSIKFDIRYATTNNFVGEKFYTQAKAFLQRPAADALLRAHQWLKKYGFGLLIHDAYRPWYVTKMFWDATPDDKKIFVADPSKGSRHNRGCAVDLTLYDLGMGKQVEMTGGYDEMSERSYPTYPGGTSLERWHRDLLRTAMESVGFTVYDWEWWHFDYKDWRKYAIGTKTFEELAR